MPLLAPLAGAIGSAAATPIGGAAISAGLGYLGNSMNKGQAGQQPGIYNMPQYSFTEPRLRQISDFVSDNISRAGRGLGPRYFDTAAPKMRREQERALRTTYYGRPGERGTGLSAQAEEMGAVTGLGPKAVSAQLRKVSDRYAEGSQAIEEFMAKERMRTTEESIKLSTYAGIQMPKGPDALVAGGYNATGPSESPDYGSMMSAFTDMMSPNANNNNGIVDDSIQSLQDMLSGNLPGPMDAWTGGNGRGASGSWENTPAANRYSNSITPFKAGATAGGYGLPSMYQGLAQFSTGLGTGVGQYVGQQLPAWVQSFLRAGNTPIRKG